MINGKQRVDKKKPLRFALTYLLIVLSVALAISLGFASEPISETESVINGGKFAAVFFPVAAGLLIIICGVFYGVYKNEFYYFDNNRLNYEFTFIVKKRVSLPLEKINVIKTKRNIIDLIIGTSVVEVGSGSMTTSMKPEIRLCLNKVYAEQFADYLRQYCKAVKEGGTFEGALQSGGMQDTPNTANQSPATPATDGAPVFVMDIADKFKYILTNPFIWLAVLFAAIAIPTVYYYAPPDELLIICVTLAMPLLMAVCLCFVRAFISFYDYRIIRTDDGIKISYGLLNKKSYLISYDKIHGFQITRDLIRQMFNTGSLKLCVIGFNEETSQNNNVYSATYLYPCGSVNKLKEIAGVLLPSFKYNGEMNKSIKQSAVHSIVFPVLISIILTLPLLIYFAIEFNFLAFVIPCACIILLGCGNGLLLYKYAGFGIDGNFVCAQSGGFVKTYSVIKTSSVQEISTYAGFIRRRQSLCTYLIFFRGSNPIASRIFVRNVPAINLDDLK